MAKLHDMFTQARRAQSSGGIGFVGKNKPLIKPRAAALVVELPNIDAGDAESAIKSGADGLLFTWNGNDASALESLKDAFAKWRTEEVSRKRREARGKRGVVLVSAGLVRHTPAGYSRP